MNYKTRKILFFALLFFQMVPIFIQTQIMEDEKIYLNKKRPLKSKKGLMGLPKKPKLKIIEEEEQDSVDSEEVQQELERAIFANDINGAKNAISKGADVNKAGMLGILPLARVIKKNGSNSLIHLLLNAGADIFKSKKFSLLYNMESPLEVANQKNKAEELIKGWIIVKHTNYFSKKKQEQIKEQVEKIPGLKEKVKEIFLNIFKELEEKKYFYDESTCFQNIDETGLIRLCNSMQLIIDT